MVYVNLELCAKYGNRAAERKGLKPEGFDFGNSPREFTNEVVIGRHIILTTTDGTKALQAAKGRGPVFVGSFLNAEAVSKKVYEVAEAEGRGITLVASGLKGEVSLEDTVCAGRIIEGLPRERISLSDAALTAFLASRGAGDEVGKISQTSVHGKYLESIGLGEDLRFCTMLNVSKIVPVMVGDELVPMSQIKSSLS
jgi:2-phosphosulfolactate phosphatase